MRRQACPAANVRREWDSFKSGSPGARMRSLSSINRMLAEERLTDSEPGTDEDDCPDSPSSPAARAASTLAQRSRPQKTLRPNRSATVSSKPTGYPKARDFLSQRPALEIPEEVIRSAVRDVMHRNSRDVTMRSLRLQLQNALGADFSSRGAGDLLKRIVSEEQDGAGAEAQQVSFLAELKAMKAQRDKEKVVRKEQGTLKKERPSVSNTQPQVQTQVHVENDFQRRQRLGLLTNAERLKLKEISTLHTQRLVRGFLGRRKAAREAQDQIDARAAALEKAALERAAAEKAAAEKAAAKKAAAEKAAAEKAAAEKAAAEKAAAEKAAAEKAAAEKAAAEKAAAEKAAAEKAAAEKAAAEKAAAEKAAALALKIKRNKNANDIQRVFRAWVRRRFYLELRKRRRKQAATKSLQRIWRGTRGRKIAFEKRQCQKYRNSAITIQSTIRRRLAVKRMQLMLCAHQETMSVCAVRLQSAARSWLAKRILHRKRTIRMEKLRKRQQHASRRRLAATQIQKIFRGHQNHMKFVHAIRAVITIQCMVRHRARRKRVESRVETGLRHGAAMKIQTHARLVLARRKYTSQRVSAVRLQSVYRGWSHRCANRFPESDRGATPASSNPPGAPSSPPLPSSSILPDVLSEKGRTRLERKPYKQLPGKGRLSVGAIRTSGWTDKDNDILDGLNQLRRRKHGDLPRRVRARVVGTQDKRRQNRVSGQFCGSFSTAQPIVDDASARRFKRISGDVPVRPKKTILSTNVVSGELNIDSKARVGSVDPAKHAEGFLPPVSDAAPVSGAAKNKKGGKRPAWNSLFGVQQQYESPGISAKSRHLRMRYL